MLRAGQQEAEEGGTEKGTTCRGAGTLHQVEMVPHPNYLLPSEREMCPWAISKYFGD
jgi:hypothetical protein